jgi:uncharacterized membrane protein
MASLVVLKFDTLDGAFWGLLFGLIFFVPLFGMAIGAAIRALAVHFSNTASTTILSRRSALSSAGA